MIRKDAVKLFIFLTVIAAFYLITMRMGSVQKREESALVEEAVRSATCVCYAVEGSYPPDIDYLKDNYHLMYNEKKYRITYRAFASNVMPDIYVVERGDG
ncbi:MAG: hypothetical protein J6S83_03100 [Lachnospiraceae bacterium]|nr:hypothetical protein [Lachnospiraceae bacterium]